jgi:hypothetical protein
VKRGIAKHVLTAIWRGLAAILLFLSVMIIGNLLVAFMQKKNAVVFLFRPYTHREKIL